MADEIHKINSALFEFNLFDDHGDIMARFIICYLLKINYVKNLEELNTELKLKKNKDKLKNLLFCILINIIGFKHKGLTLDIQGDIKSITFGTNVNLKGLYQIVKFFDITEKNIENSYNRLGKEIDFSKRKIIYKKLTDSSIDYEHKLSPNGNYDIDDSIDYEDKSVKDNSIIARLAKCDIKTNKHVRYLAEVFIDNIDNELIRTKLDLDKPPDVKYPPFLRALLAYTGKYACQKYPSKSIKLIPLSDDGKSNLINILKTIQYNDISVDKYYEYNPSIIKLYSTNSDKIAIAEPNYLQDPSSGINCYKFILNAKRDYKSTLINAINDIIGVENKERIPYALGAIKYQNIGFIIKILLDEKINQPQPSPGPNLKS